MDDVVEIAVQLSGRLKGRTTISMNADNETALAAAKAVPELSAAIAGKEIVKEIVITNKLVNIVVK